MRKKMRKVIKRIVTQADGCLDDSQIGQRARIAERIAECAENGMVTLHIWQMDCDCASWDMFRQYPARPFVISDEIDQAQDNAEGPIRISIIKPSEEPEPEDVPRPRDHALEAFEDGHPHSIHLGA